MEAALLEDARQGAQTTGREPVNNLKNIRQQTFQIQNIGSKLDSSRFHMQGAQT